VNYGARRARPWSHPMLPIERTVRWVLLAGLATSVVLMAAGVVLALIDGAHLPRGVVPLGELWSGLVGRDPAAYLSLGLIVLIGTPFVRVGGSLVAFARERDRRYVFVTAVVLTVMCLSVALGRA
jgi:uncharacterized membrane protein